jgi:hypothetical protein
LVGVGGTAWRIWIMFLIISLPSLVIPSYSCRAETGAFVVIMCQAIQQFSNSALLYMFSAPGGLRLIVEVVQSFWDSSHVVQ